MEGVNNVNQNGVEQNPNQPHSQPAENQPQPIGAENQPQPIGAENQPQPIGAENQPQPIGAENQPQPASIAGNLGNGIGDDEDAIEQRKRTSDVWPHFHRLKVHGVGKAQCKYCRKILSGESNSGTSHLRSHRNRCIQKKIHDGRKKVLGPDYLPTGKPQLVATEYNYDVTIKELCSMILVHEYPLSIVDHIGFRRYSCSLQPLFQVPSRNTIKKEILTLYGVQSAKIRRELDGNRGRIAVTTDMWTATNHKRGYMALTAHYIDNSWKLRSIMLRFLYVPAPHTSERLANRLCTSLMIWNIDGKLSAITLDNCTTNDSMVTQVRDKLNPSNLLMDGALLHMRCSAHILNLIVRDGLDVIKEGIEKIRDSVLYWTATPKRVEFFTEIARQVKAKSDKKLVFDCPTRWNSTYHMLSVAIPYKDVFFRLRQFDTHYTYVPTMVHWDFATVVVDKLQYFDSITELFSGSKYHTTNLFFPKICELRLRIMEWCFDQTPIISAMAGKMWLKFGKYWDDIHLVLVVAVVLDPRYKLHVIEYFAAKLGSTNSDLVGDNVRNVLCSLIIEY
ncbi:Putative AC transposase [Linum perenne]